MSGDWSAARAAEYESVFSSSERAPPHPLPLLRASDELSFGPELAAALRAAPPRWVACERAFLALVRRECAGELAAAPPFPDAYGERRLLRFLRHLKSSDKALVAVKKYLRYRCAHELDAVRLAISDHELCARPLEWPNGAFFAERCAVLPCSTWLFDVKGNALCVEQYGFWPAHRLRDVTAEDYLAWQSYALEWKMVQLERLSLGRERELLRASLAGRVVLREGWGEIARLCTVMDLRGLTFSHAVLPGGVLMLKQLIPIVQKNYPWLQDTTYVVNASGSVYFFWSMLRPLLPYHTQSKIQIHSTDPAHTLADSISPHNLPTQLGGQAPCAELVPPPTVDDFDAAATAANDDQRRGNNNAEEGHAATTAEELKEEPARDPLEPSLEPQPQPPSVVPRANAPASPGVDFFCGAARTQSQRPTREYRYVRVSLSTTRNLGLSRRESVLRFRMCDRDLERSSGIAERTSAF